MNEFAASAPARATLIGEHTDYPSNGGHVLSTPLPLMTTVQAAAVPGRSGDVMISSSGFDEVPCTRSLASNRLGHWSDYVVGCLRAASVDVKLPALKIDIDSRIPMACGIASSAALCVAVIRALKGLLGTQWIDEEIALLAHHAEHDYVGVPCGKTDQFASSLGRPGQAMLLDTKALRSRNYRLDSRTSLMIVACGVRHARADSHRMRLQRVAECKEACDRLGARTLCELGQRDLPRLSALSGVIARRAWYVITENIRVAEFVQALEQGDTVRQADLMEASHASQRDNFECSTPEIDALVNSSRRFGVRAARQVGSGFGGAIVALVPREKVSDWWAHVSAENPGSSLITPDLSQRQNTAVPDRIRVVNERR